MDIKIINESSREVPEELIESLKNEEGFDVYQKILDEYNLKFSEIDLHLSEDKITVVIKDR